MNVKQEEEALLPHLVEVYLLLHSCCSINLPIKETDTHYFRACMMQVSIEINAEGERQKCSVESLNNWTQPTDFPVINLKFFERKNE